MGCTVMMKQILLGLLAAASVMGAPKLAVAGEFSQPWRDKQKAIVIDGYEHNEFDLTEMVKDKRVAAFIHKASDGMPAAYRCEGNETERKLCRQTWRRYVIARELYHTRKQLAKALGMKWGAYHLGRPGNPIQQAQHFLDYAKPADDEVMVIDIEDNDPEKWMSLKDAERFARYIEDRTGRWPMLYTNGSTASYIAQNRDDYPILSRLPLWYARYKPSISGYFPKGNWDTYGIWQFAAQVNCTKRACPYRVPGTNRDIDVNIVDMTVAELKDAWPFDSLVDAKPSENGPSDDHPLDKNEPAEAPAMLMVELGDNIYAMPLPRFAKREVTADMLLDAHVHAASMRTLGALEIDVEAAANIDPVTTATMAGPINDLF